jgi:hypothetical protein
LRGKNGCYKKCRIIFLLVPLSTDYSLIKVLERARKAESEAQSYKSQLKQETANAKRSIREMEMSLAESTALSAKSEREYITLRDSVKHMVEGWKEDVERLKEDMSRKEQEWKDESELMGKKYQDLRKLVEESRCVSFDSYAQSHAEDRVESAGGKSTGSRRKPRRWTRSSRLCSEKNSVPSRGRLRNPPRMPQRRSRRQSAFSILLPSCTRR